MALSDNPFIGLTAAELQAKRTLWLTAMDDIAKTGKSYSFPGLSLTHADLSEIRQTLSDLRVALDLATGVTSQVAQAVINTRRQFSGR